MENCFPPRKDWQSECKKGTRPGESEKTNTQVQCQTKGKVVSEKTKKNSVKKPSVFSDFGDSNLPVDVASGSGLTAASPPASMSSKAGSKFSHTAKIGIGLKTQKSHRKVK